MLKLQLLTMNVASPKRTKSYFLPEWEMGWGWYITLFNFHISCQSAKGLVLKICFTIVLLGILVLSLIINTSFFSNFDYNMKERLEKKATKQRGKK